MMRFRSTTQKLFAERRKSKNSEFNCSKIFNNDNLTSVKKKHRRILSHFSNERQNLLDESLSKAIEVVSVSKSNLKQEKSERKMQSLSRDFTFEKGQFEYSHTVSDFRLLIKKFNKFEDIEVQYFCNKELSLQQSIHHEESKESRNLQNRIQTVRPSSKLRTLKVARRDESSKSKLQSTKIQQKVFKKHAQCKESLKKMKSIKSTANLKQHEKVKTLKIEFNNNQIDLK